MTLRLLIVTLASLLLAPQRAVAQQADGWGVDFAPLYFQASELDGTLAAGPATVPIFETNLRCGR